ncbi:MAG: phosphotransferase [Halieaceae bacterium]|nr:phosphotransferase [Halieaceae bacterium]
MPSLLSSIDEIDAAWLQSVFSAAGKDIPVIRKLRIEALGDGKTGTTVKAVLEYEGNGSVDPATAPSSVVCKFHPADPNQFEIVKSTGIFLAEANAQKLLAEHSEAAVPECYFVAVADDAGEFNLVCEDLSGFCVPGDQIAGCSIDDARTAMAELAKFHRQFWNEPRLESVEWAAQRPEFLDNALEMILDRIKRLLSADQYEVVIQAVPRIHDWLELQPINKTLIHNDCKIDNILFDHRNAKEPKAYLIDFAMVSVGDAASDIAYFLTSSLSPENRLACELDLLKLHSGEIAKKDPSHTFENAVQAYRDNIVSSLFLTLFFAVHVTDTPEARLLLKTLLERNCAAVEHWTP